MAKKKTLKDLKPGKKATLTRPVEFHRTLKYYQDHLPALLTTPSMIGQMEVTAAHVMVPFQPEDMLSLGTHINVSHQGPAKVNEKLRTTAAFKKKYKPNHGGATRYVFAVEARVGRRLIGKGEVERAAITRPTNAYKKNTGKPSK
jgi:predicted thioesterase